MISVNLPASIDQLSHIQKIITESMTTEMPEVIFKMQLIAEELLTNICKYAYNSNKGETIFYCGYVNMDNQRLFKISFSDSGNEYDPFLSNNVPDTESSLEERQAGGVGIYLIKTFATHYMYERLENKNIVTIFFDTEEKMEDS